MIDNQTWQGVNALLDDYVQLRDDDVAVVAYTKDSREPAAWVAVALKARGIAPRLLSMAPIYDDDFGNRLRLLMPEPSELHERLVFLTFERSTMSHNRQIKEALAQYDERKWIVVRAISSCSALFSHALKVSPQELSARNATIINYCGQASRLRVTTDAGTDLRIELDNQKYRWISNRGVWTPGSFILLPAGEVATFPSTINGTLVADFAFNLNALTEFDSRLTEHPVTAVIEDRRLTSLQCKNTDVQQFLEKCFEQSACCKLVGELGFGTNYAISEPISMNSHINERRPGIHIGFGDHNQGKGRVSYECSLHLDLIAGSGRIFRDDDPVPLDLTAISPTLAEHPLNYCPEDIFSPEDKTSEQRTLDDCCGIMTADGLRLFDVSNS